IPFAQRLTVIRHYHDHRILQSTVFVQPVYQSPKLMIAISYLAVVQVGPLRAKIEIAARLVRSMRLERVQIRAKRTVSSPLLKGLDEGIHALFHVAGASAADQVRIFDTPVESCRATRWKENRVVAVASQRLGPRFDMSIPV